MLDIKLEVYNAAVLEEADGGLEALVRLLVFNIVVGPPLLFVVLILFLLINY